MDTREMQKQVLQIMADVEREIEDSREMNEEGRVVYLSHVVAEVIDMFSVRFRSTEPVCAMCEIILSETDFNLYPMNLAVESCIILVGEAAQSLLPEMVNYTKDYYLLSQVITATYATRCGVDVYGQILVWAIARKAFQDACVSVEQFNGKG